MRALSITLIGCVGFFGFFGLACSAEPAPLPSAALGSSSVSGQSAPLEARGARHEALTSPARPSVDDSAIGRGRDPFAPGAVAVSPPPADTLARKARRYSLDDLRLVGVVGGGAERAMLLDPRGKGWVVSQGDHVGRFELAAGGGTVGWRVARIRDAEVVFSRTDQTRPDLPAETRTLALRTGEAAPLDMDD